MPVSHMYWQRRGSEGDLVKITDSVDLAKFLLCDVGHSENRLCEGVFVREPLHTADQPNPGRRVYKWEANETGEKQRIDKRL